METIIVGCDGIRIAAGASSRDGRRRISGLRGRASAVVERPKRYESGGPCLLTSLPCLAGVLALGAEELGAHELPRRLHKQSVLRLFLLINLIHGKRRADLVDRAKERRHGPLAFISVDSLSGHLKTGQSWTGQNRPVEVCRTGTIYRAASS